MRIVQINLQPHFGGGEIYTKFLCRALARLGVVTTLIHHGDSRFWQGLGLPDSTELSPAWKIEEAIEQLPSARNWVLSHGPFAPQHAGQISQRHLLTAIAHMPPQMRPRDRYDSYSCVFGVSAYVVQGLRDIGAAVWNAPLYGVADLHRVSGSMPIRQTSRYEWDRRKGRDRLLSWLEPIVEPLRMRPIFHRGNGVSLGIVSRLTPIKQFPEMFGILAPIIAKHADFRLEIFGAGGYASVLDLRQATRILGDRVRFWGLQRDIAAVYQQLDYLMTGLPEKEALGLNVIEAQACNTPILGVKAPPFTETVLDGQTGLLYTDPRLDQGQDFSRILDELTQHRFRITNNLDVTEHLARFSEEAFASRLAPVVEYVRKNL